MEKRYYSPREVADILSVSDDTVREWVNTGKLPALRLSERVTRIPIAAFELFRDGYKPRRRQVVVRRTSRRFDLGADERLVKKRALVEG